MFGLFANGFKRGDGWAPELPDPLESAAADLPQPTDEAEFACRLWRTGVTDRAEQSRLWQAEKRRRAKRDQVRAKRGK